MRDYFKDIPKLVTELEEQKSFENVIKLITKFSSEKLGNRSRALESGNLKSDEKNQFACGSFILIDDNKQILIGPQNYAPEQHYMILDTNVGHPGWVIKNKRRLILPNTDTHKSFVKILKTFRAGSAIYAPIITSDRFIGQIICASQARNVMEEIDLSTLCVLSNLASLYWVKLNGLFEINEIFENQSTK
jgi:hypothetical protein